MKKAFLLRLFFLTLSGFLYGQGNPVRLSIESYYSDEGPLNSKDYDPDNLGRVYVDNPNSFLSRGIKKQESKFYKDALPDFNEAIDLVPDCGVCYYYRGLNYFLMDSLALAKQDYFVAIKNDVMLIQAYNDLSNIYFAENKMDSAELILEKGMQFYQAYLPTYFNLGYYKLVQGRRAKAMKLFDKCLEMDSCHLGATVMKVSILLTNDKVKDAEILLDKAGKCDNKMTELHLLNSVVKYERKKTNDAIAEINKAITIKENYLYYFFRGLLNVEIEKFEAALDDFYKSYQLNPLESKDYSGGYTYRKRQLDYQAIMQAYFGKKSNFNEVENAHLGKSICYLVSEEYSKAENELRELKKLNGSSDFFYLLSGLVKEKTYNFDKAKSSYDQCLSINNKNTEAYKRRGLLYQREGNIEAAISDFNEMYNLNPLSSEALKYRGIANMLNKNYKLALVDFDEYEAKFESDGDIYFNKGQCENQLGELADAVVSFKRVLTLNPTDLEVIFQIAQNDYSLGRLEESLMMCDSILNNTDCHVMATNLKGVIQMDLKQHENALTTFKSGIACSPRYTDFYVNKGIALIKLGRNEDAIKQIDLTLTVAPYSGLAYLIRAQAKYNIGDKSACKDLDKAIELGIQITPAQRNAICK